MKYSQTEKGLVFDSRLWVMLSVYSLPFSSLLFLFSLPSSLQNLCMHIWLHKQHSWHMPGFGSTEKFYFLLLLVKQLGPWIGCVLRGNHEVHRAYKAPV